MKNWYIVHTQDYDHEAGYPKYHEKCNNDKEIKESVEKAMKIGIPCWRLTISEYEYDKNCEDNQSFIDQCNAEIYLS